MTGRSHKALCEDDRQRGVKARAVPDVANATGVITIGSLCRGGEASC
jgi:hypothetical protein